jgi:formylmethanofuran dehydrogenase subunit D
MRSAAMTAAVAVARAERLLGEAAAGSAHGFDIEVRAGAYVCGEETSLLESLEGRRGIVRAKPPLRAHAGLFGRPTVINNVLSLASVPIVLAQGATHFRDFGIGRSRGTMPIWVKLASRSGATTLRALITERVAPGVIYTTFHHPGTQANVVTTEYSDWATNCPEYKVTAVQVTPSNGPSEWQERYDDLARKSRRIAPVVEPAE